MQKYLVIALSVSGKAPKRIYDSGDVVDQTCFTRPVEDIEKEGSIKAISDEEAEKRIAENASKSPSSPGVMNQVPPLPNYGSQGQEGGGKELTSEELAEQLKASRQKDFDKLSKAKVVESLTAADVEFDPKTNKDDLFDLWVATLG